MFIFNSHASRSSISNESLILKSKQTHIPCLVGWLGLAWIGLDIGLGWLGNQRLGPKVSFILDMDPRYVFNPRYT